MFRTRPTEGQLVYQVTEGFKFIGGAGDHPPFKPIDELSRTDCPIKFRAVSVSLIQTASIDIDNNLWMSGYAG